MNVDEARARLRRELRQEAREEDGHLRVAEVRDDALPVGGGRREAFRRTDRPGRSRRAAHAPARASARRGRRGRSAPASLTARKAGSEARRSAVMPALAASVHTAWPVETPSAVSTPARRPPSSVLRIVSAVSWPGVTITSAETPRNARSSFMRARVRRRRRSRRRARRSGRRRGCGRRRRSLLRGAASRAGSRPAAGARA